MNKHNYFKQVLLLLCSIICNSVIVLGEVTLPKVFTSNMVLQRDKTVQIWGWADKNEKVKIYFNNQVVATRADKNGAWDAELSAMEAGGPYELVIKGKNDIKLENILIGDVWICSGQSNMAWQVQNSNHAEEEMANANYEDIRLFTVPRELKFEPAKDISGGEWLVCNPENVASFSAVGYFFGRHIHKEIGVPVGLISDNWGGTVVETWISEEAVSTIDDFSNQLEEMKSIDLESDLKKTEERRKQLLEDIGEEKGIVDGKALWARSGIDLSEWKNMQIPQLWENAGLNGVDGTVWFRSEFNLTEEEAENPVSVYLGPIDDSDVSYINGKEIGSTTDKYDEPRIYFVPEEIVKPGKNTLVVKVIDTGGGGGIYGDKDDLYIQTSQGKIALGGEWKYRISPSGLKINPVQRSPNSYPTLLFNGMINPVIPFTIKGAIWYQGESNASRAYQYRKLFPLMINDWRNKWGQGDFPFLFVQLANFKQPVDEPKDDEWAELREAQLMTLSVPNTGMAVTIDIGEADDIHPRNKQEVGRRLGLAAEKVAYDKDVVYSGPLYKSMEKDGDKIKIHFSNVGSGLQVRDKYGYLQGFSIAGPDKEFKWAKAYIEDENTVVVYNNMVKQPVAVRYAWAANPDDANLYNKEGLPASPFRTDEWKGITED